MNLFLIFRLKMGVPGLFGSWLQYNNDEAIKLKRSRFISNYNVDNPPEINSLSLDYNALIHTFAAAFFGKLNEKNSDFNRRQNEISKKLLIDFDRKGENIQKKFIDHIISETENLFDKFTPSYEFILAVDGVPPKAKMEKQRKGRYDTDARILGEISGGETPSFNSNCITPGTNFMFELDIAIKQWINKLQLRHPSLNLFYSSHMMPGEGEHKIYEIFRKNHLEKSKGMDIIYGMDADLILLSLLNNERDFHLFREDSWKRDMIHIIDIKKLRDFLADYRKISPRDFLIMSLFLGNDFVPRMRFSFEFNNPEKKDDISGSLASIFDILLDSYKKFKEGKKNKDDIFIKDNRVNFDTLSEFFSELEDVEKILLEERFTHEEKKKNKDIFFNEDDSFDIEKYSQRVEKFNIQKMRVYDQKGLNVELSFILKLYDDSERSEKIKLTKYSTLSNVEFLKTYHDSEKQIEEFSVNEITMNFLVMFEWIYFYYTGAKYNPNYSFKYHYSPTIFTIKKMLPEYLSVLNNFVAHKLNIGPRWNAIQQLIAILPYTSWNLIPKDISEGLMSNSVIPYFYPNPSSILSIAEENNMLSVSMLPFIDEGQIFRQSMLITLSIETAKLYQEEEIMILKRTFQKARGSRVPRPGPRRKDDEPKKILPFKKFK